MDTTERARLRAQCDDVALPLRAECTLSGHEIADADGEYIGAVETEHSDDDEWCDEVHAALIVGAVNALPALLDDSERLDAVTRERDEARAEVERLRADRDALRAAPTFTDGWRAAREAAAKFHEARAGFTAERLGHAEAHPEMMPADVRHDVTEGFRESIAQDGLDADAIRGLALPDDADAAVRAAEDGQRAQCAKFSTLWRGVAKKARANSAAAVARAVATEREACAVLCEDAAGAEASMGDAERAEGDDGHADARMTRASALRQMARAIRARGAGGGA